MSQVSQESILKQEWQQSLLRFIIPETAPLTRIILQLLCFRTVSSAHRLTMATTTLHSGLTASMCTCTSFVMLLHQHGVRLFLQQQQALWLQRLMNTRFRKSSAALTVSMSFLTISSSSHGLLKDIRERQHVQS